MNLQDHRSTYMPLYIVVATEREYGIESGWRDGVERNLESICPGDLCESCLKLQEEDAELPEDCDDCDSDCFVGYRDKHDVPQMEYGVFFTAEACDEYIKRRSYSMPKNAHSYAISAYWCTETKQVLQYLSTLGSEDGKPHENYIHTL